MTIAPPRPEFFDGLHPYDSLCIAPTEELAMEIAQWLFRGPGGRLAMPPLPLLRILDATDHPVVRGYLVFWPGVADRANADSRWCQLQAIAHQFPRRGLRSFSKLRVFSHLTPRSKRIPCYPSS